LPGNNTALLASSGTITISEETIVSFNARAAKAVCYIDGGYGPQEGNPCDDECDPENMFPGGEDSGYRDWRKEVNNMYNKGSRDFKAWKEIDNCGDLKGAWEKQHDIWKNAQRKGFTGDYTDYHPGDDIEYLVDIAKKFDPDKCSFRISDEKKYEWAYQNEEYRRAIAGLQVLDCLKKKMGCEW
ncbi:hypothetical protein LLG10_03785, partial [bacterium]|nr:hypothetical protein [bacterium]